MSNRKNFIGGSEVATILKQNKHKSVSQLVMEKLGFSKFKGNVITHWGNVFEDLIRQYSEQIFKCTIFETGSIPYAEGSLSFSPDGLAVVPTSMLIQHLGGLAKGLDPNASSQLVLFEFKCPHSRVPSHEIPEYYRPQVSIGMNIIDIMETAIFVQATYRRCAFRQLKYNTFHNGMGHFKRADTSGDPIECGFMTIYADEHSSYIDDLKTAMLEVGDAAQLHVARGQTILDIGTLQDIPMLEEVLGNCVNHSFHIDYACRLPYDTNVYGRDSYVRSMYDDSLQHRATQMLQQQLSKHPHIIGVLPYKLLNVYLTPVSKNPAFIEETKACEKAASVLKCIDDHQDYTDKSTVSKSVRKYKL